MIIKNLKGLVRNVLFHNNSWATVYYSICSSKFAPKSASGQPTETAWYPQYFWTDYPDAFKGGFATAYRIGACVFWCLAYHQKFTACRKYQGLVADFVVLDQRHQVLAIIEIADQSYVNRLQQKHYQDSLLELAGYRVLRYSAIPTEQELRKDLIPDLCANIQAGVICQLSSQMNLISWNCNFAIAWGDMKSLHRHNDDLIKKT